MSLLGTPLLWLLGALAVAVPVAAYVLWARVQGPRWLRIAQRVSMIVVAQVAALSLAAVAINDYGYFYGSWSELAAGVGQFVTGGSGQNSPAAGAAEPHAGSVPSAAPGRATPVSTGHPVNAATAGSLAVQAYPSFSRRAQWSGHGRIDSVTIHGGVTQLSSHAYVYLPPQYFQPRYAHSWFPAVEVFSGYPGRDQNLISRMHYQDVLGQLVAEHRAGPMVLVMLRPSVTFPRDTECTDVPAGPQAESFFAVDVVAQVARHYRVHPTHWGAMGDSTGGYCAAKLAMLDPGTFHAAVALSGYFFALHDRTTGELWGGSRLVRDLNDLHWRLQHLPAPAVSVLVCTSPAESGPDGYAEARRFVAQIRAPMVADVLTVPHGGHNFTTWDAELPAALGWLGRRLPGPGPSPGYTVNVRGDGP